MSIALGALRNRTQLADGALVPWTSPLGKPMSIAATVPEFTWSDIAYALTPNGANARLRRQRDLPRRRPPRRRAEAELEQLALPRRQVLGYYAPLGTDPAADITGWKALTDTGGPFDANPAAAAMVSELTANHSAYYLDDSDRARPRAARQRLERRPLPGRRVAALLQQGPREVPERADLDVPPRLRPQPARGRDLRRRPRRADRGRERLAGLLRQGRRRRSPPTRAAASTSSPPSARSAAPARATTRRPGRCSRRARSGSTAPRRRRSPRPAPRRATRSPPATSARRRRAPTTRAPRPTSVPAATSAYTLAGSPTIIAKLNVTGRQRHGRRAALRRRRRDAAADRPRRPAPARTRAAARPSRSSSCTRRPGRSSPATCSSSSCSPRTRSTCARRTGQQQRHRQRSPAAAAGRRRAGQGPRTA